MIPEHKCPQEVRKLMVLPGLKYHTALKLNVRCFSPSTDNIGVKGVAVPPGAAFWSVSMGHGFIDLPEVPPLAQEFPSIKLRPEQVPLFEMAKRVRGGLLEFKTGGGKSIIMIALTQCWGGKTLIVVHAQDMVEQFYEKYKEFLNIEVGRFNTHHKDIKDITITTFSSARQNAQLFYEYGFDNLLIDECDAFFTEQARQFICLFNGIRVFGFTATTRSPYDEYLKKDEVPALRRFYGLHIRDRGDTPQTETMKCVLREIRQTLYSYPEGTYKNRFFLDIRPADGWAVFREHLDADKERKNFQLRFILNGCEADDRALVLFDRVADVELFYKTISNLPQMKDKTFIIHGSIKKGTRELSKASFLSHGGIMVAQHQTSSRGIDYPECNKVFLMYPIKGQTMLRQIIGRALRWLPNKDAYIYDMVESTLLFQWFARKKVYQEFFPGVPITFIETK